MSSRGPLCHACGAARIERLGPVGLQPTSVRSDSLPCDLPAVIWRCASCGHLQKHPTAAEREEIDRIYATYEAHHLAGGCEQVVFVDGTVPTPRTLHCLKQCLPMLPQRGALLDVGTGNGAVLRSAGSLLPGWSLYAFDVGDRYRDEIEAMRGVKGFWSEDLCRVPLGEFDLVVLWQTLEHIPDPVAFLVQVAEKLAPGGRLLIQVPDVLRTPFDVAVIDHESHFGPAQLSHVCSRAGLRIVLEGHAWVHNCLTLLLEMGDAAEEAEAKAAETAWLFPWVQDAVRSIAEDIEDSPFAIFGTGMAGIWLAGQVGHLPEYFIDEDEAREGNEVSGVPIVSPARADANVPIVMSFAQETGARIARRVAASHENLAEARFILPPPLVSGRDGDPHAVLSGFVRTKGDSH